MQWNIFRASAAKALGNLIAGIGLDADGDFATEDTDGKAAVVSLLPLYCLRSTVLLVYVL